jgi:hypothetical protein
MASAVLELKRLPDSAAPWDRSATFNFVVGPFASMLGRARDIIAAALK